jgi:hypothetical protein
VCAVADAFDRVGQKGASRAGATKTVSFRMKIDANVVSRLCEIPKAFKSRGNVSIVGLLRDVGLDASAVQARRG